MGRIAATYGTELGPLPVDGAIAELARRQYGVVALHQLRTAGLSDRAARGRVRAGRLHRIHRGVYAVGHPLLSREGCFMAAVLACGDGAALSHWSAAHHLGIYANDRTRIDVIVSRRSGRRVAGLRIHRPRCLDTADTTVVRGIPCTTVARTLLDLAAEARRRTVELASERAEMLRLYDGRAIRSLLERTRTHRGSAVLKAVMAVPATGTLTRSELEERFLAICDGAGLPRPRVNLWIELRGGPVEVDFAWSELALIVEVDGFETHGTRHGFESDRRKDVRLELAEWRVFRFTWRQLTHEPDYVRDSVVRLYAARSATTSRTP